jgi:predicted phosphodiesterase
VRFALLSDIHANIEAFDACLAHARARGVDRLALLGDFVGYGADAAAVVDTVMRWRRRWRDRDQGQS